MDSSAELVFIPGTGAGHLVSAVEIAKLLVARDPRLSITLLLLKLPFESSRNATAESLSSSTAVPDRIRFVDLPRDPPPADSSLEFFLRTFCRSQKPHVRDAVRKIGSGLAGSTRLAGFVLDMFCTSMTDVADEFGVPSYVFFTSGAGLLCVMTHMLGREESGDAADIKDEISVAGFIDPIPEKALPSVVLDKALAPIFNDICRGVAKAKGVLVNTFAQLEPGMINALSSHHKFPPVYPVGPIITFSPGEGSHGGFGGTDRKAEIVEWLDRQPDSSVAFLCFGSMGSFEGKQVSEIAMALERSGVRFLWSLRRPPQKDKTRTPTDYDDPAEVLPEGFLDRTAVVGKVIGWAPQVEVLAHPAVGGFVSHCGWNSTLESVWFGVPLAAWPLYAEQHLNAWAMVTELGLAVEITMDYKKEFTSERSVGGLLVKAEQIEIGLRRLMESESDTRRKRVKEMSQKSRKALLEGGSSSTSLAHFINEVMESTA